LKSILLTQAFPQFDEALRVELDNKGTLVLYKKGDILIRTGDPLNGVSIILSGCVKVYRENEKIKGKQFVISFVKQGHSFGVSVSDDSIAKARIAILTFEATEPAYVLNISFADKDLLAKKFNQWYRYILQTAVQFYGFYIELIDNITFNNLDERIFFYLSQLSEAAGSKIIKITHKEIANNLNASRESVSRILKKAEETKKIKLGHNAIEILSALK
jgi:CRP/FNR family transcriptional regulator, anaerobic regulatory protein